MEYSEILKLIDNHTDISLNRAKDLQPFENYYIWRASEFKNLIFQTGVESWGDVLEVGCGNGFNSALMSILSKKVVATDLKLPDKSRESLGIDNAIKLIDKIGIKNCNVIPSSAEDLPFKDKSFDIVYSNYTLEHIENRQKAVSEMMRVLKDGGLIITTVPNFIERLTYIPVYYFYILRRIFFHIFKMFKRSFLYSSESKKTEKVFSENLRPKTFWERNRNFPFPDIHGFYSTFSQELVASTYTKWSRLFNMKGIMQVKIFNTILMPWHLFSLLSPRLPLWLYIKASPLQRKLGDLPFLRIFGHNLCFIHSKINERHEL